MIGRGRVTEGAVRGVSFAQLRFRQRVARDLTGRVLASTNVDPVFAQSMVCIWPVVT
jgi:hypothetical protein